MRNIEQKIKLLGNQLDRIGRRQIRNMQDMSEIAKESGWLRKPHLMKEYDELERHNKELQQKYSNIVKERKELQKKSE
jgi:hypothetical protein